LIFLEKAPARVDHAAARRRDIKLALAIKNQVKAPSIAASTSFSRRRSIAADRAVA